MKKTWNKGEKMKDYIYGKNAVANALISGQNIINLYMSPSFFDKKINQLIKEKHIKYIKTNDLNKYVGNVVHQGIVCEIEEYEYTPFEDILVKVKDKKDALVVLLDGIEDPHNFGAILRSADAFGIDAVIIPQNRSVRLNGTVAKVSTGAIEYVDVCMVTNLNQTIQKLKDEGFWVVASDGSATMDYRQVDYNMKTCLVVGSEGFGISKLVLKNSDFIVKIPMVGHVNSLNASVACALFLAQIYSYRNPVK